MLKFMFHEKLSIRRCKEFRLRGNSLAPLLMLLQRYDTRTEYYINDSVSYSQMNRNFGIN